MSNLKTLQEVEALEERLQIIKWTIGIVPQPMRALTPLSPSSSIVSRTVALLGRRFPRGVTYERRLRRSWNKRLQRSGL